MAQTTNSGTAASAGTVAGAARSDAVSFAVIASTIIPVVPDPAQFASFYDDAYSQPPGQAEVYSRWRALGAAGKADHVIGLCRSASVVPASTLEIGCGDGALLSELHRRGFGGQLSGVEISEAAVRIARQRHEIESVEVYDGQHLPADDGGYELAILSHVLEHVADPPALLREAARVSRAIVVEVPLEANWSARRTGKRAQAVEVGHLQRLDRGAVRALVARAGLVTAAELQDALPLAAQRFFATSRPAQLAAAAKWSVRVAVNRLAPPLARRLFTVHYACLCLQPDG